MRKIQFCFDKKWIGQDGLLDSIGKGWIDSRRNNKGDFVEKLSNCRYEIARWIKNYPPYRNEKINELQKALEEVQSDDSRTQKAKVEVFRKLHESYKDENDYWQQKSRNMWNTSGDLNTAFYHVLTKQRRTKKQDCGLYDENEDRITEGNRVEKVGFEWQSKHI